MRKIKKTFLIDDSDAVNLRNEVLLSESGYFEEIIKFNNAQDALNELKTVELPDLIMLDLSMPDKDGFVFLDEYVTMESVVESNHAPIIIVLSDNLGFENFTKVKDYKSYGVENHVKKPMDLEDLEMLLDEHFEDVV